MALFAARIVKFHERVSILLGIQATEPCPFCDNLIPTEAILCLQCGKALKQTHHDGKFLDGFDMDWLIGKDAVGHYQFSKALLTSIETEVSRAQGLDELAACWTDLETALVSLEEAGYNGAEQIVTKDLIPQLEATYRNLIENEMRIIEGDVSRKYKKGSLKVLVNESYLKGRRRIEERFSQVIPPSARWNDKLIEVVETTTGKHAVKNYSRLKDEVARCQELPNVLSVTSAYWNP